MAANVDAKPNVFVVDTPYQLLNAIEAVSFFRLSNNHLVIIEYPGLKLEAFTPLIKWSHWASVRFLPLQRFRTMVGFPFAGDKIQKWVARYRHFSSRRRVTNLAKSFRSSNHLFLGHYWVRYKYYMRHFANTLPHKRLFLLDDGTDTIDINERRKAPSEQSDQSCAASRPWGKSVVQKFIRSLLRKYWSWNLDEAESLTFFTTYQLEVKKGDYLIRNDYRTLRTMADRLKANEEVCFLGQCFVEDEDMKEEVYLEHLRKVKCHFGERAVKYVPHPRESDRMIRKIAQVVGFDIKRFGLPIEIAILTQGYLPEILASFCCSALESCANIFGDRLKVVSFRIRSEHILQLRKEADAIYSYFQEKVRPNFQILPLEINAEFPLVDH